VDDYNREFKSVQRKFRDVEAQHSLVLMLKSMPNTDKVKKASERVGEARKDRQDKQQELQSQELVDGKMYKDLLADRDKAYARYQGLKADYDSLMSYRDIAVEHVGTASESSRAVAEEQAKAREKRVR